MRSVIYKTCLVGSIALAISQPNLAFADQCQIVSQEQAEDFVSEISVGDLIGSLCEPCGEHPDASGNIPMTEVKSLEIKNTGTDAEVYVNNEGIDLAYTYIITKKIGNNITLTNAAKLVGCYCEGVTETFHTSNQ